jgi:hypothetical protein
MLSRYLVQNSALSKTHWDHTFSPINLCRHSLGRQFHPHGGAYLFHGLLRASAGAA